MLSNLITYAVDGNDFGFARRVFEHADSRSFAVYRIPVVPRVFH